MALPYAVRQRDFLMQARIGADREDLLGRQLGVSAALSPVVCAVPGPVSLVVSRRPPAKIWERVISEVAVVVAALMSRRGRRPDKGDKDEPMDLARPLLVIAPKLNLAPEFFGVFCRNLHRVSANVADTTKIGDFIEAFIAYDWFPVFHVADYPSLADMGKA